MKCFRASAACYIDTHGSERLEVTPIRGHHPALAIHHDQRVGECIDQGREDLPNVRHLDSLGGNGRVRSNQGRLGTRGLRVIQERPA
jgi:hypothetical protein